MSQTPNSRPGLRDASSTSGSGSQCFVQIAGSDVLRAIGRVDQQMDRATCVRASNHRMSARRNGDRDDLGGRGDCSVAMERQNDRGDQELPRMPSELSLASSINPRVIAKQFTERVLAMIYRPAPQFA